MNIPITIADPELTEDFENCIFCNTETAYWNEESNRPVCPICSVINTTEQIKTAPYNY